MTFGERLKILRKEFNISQDDLGKKIGVARTSVANYETNRNYPTSEVLEKLSDVFKVSIDYLLCRTDFRESIRNYDKEEQEFRFTYKKEIEGLTEEEIRYALKFYKETKENAKKTLKAEENNG